MKKLIALLLTLSTLFAASCAAVRTDGDGTTETKKAPEEQTTVGEGTTAEEQTTAEEETTEEEQTTEDSTYPRVEAEPRTFEKNGDGIYFLDTSEGSELREVKRSDDLCGKTYVDETAPKTMIIRFFGKDYETEYLNTGTFSVSDLIADSYKLKGEIEKDKHYPEMAPGFMINAVTGEIVRGMKIPMDDFFIEGKMSTDIEVYKKLIKDIFGDAISDCDFTDFSVQTEMATRTPGMIRNGMENGFLIPEENQILECYRFTYSFKTSGITTGRRLVVEFKLSKKVSFELIDFAVGTEEELDGMLDKIKISAEEYVKEHILDECTKNLKVSISSPTLRECGGTRFIACNVIYSYTSTYNPADEYDVSNLFQAAFDLSEIK